jgi:hypothetical protein
VGQAPPYFFLQFIPLNFKKFNSRTESKVWSLLKFGVPKVRISGNQRPGYQVIKASGKDKYPDNLDPDTHYLVT